MEKEKIKKYTKERGITLLALAITIIVLIILSAVTYNLTLGENGIITKAYEAKYLTELSQYKEELELFKAEKLLENNSFEGESLTSAYNSLFYNTQPEGETGTIYDVIKSLQGGTFEGKMEIIKGELLLNSQDMTEIRMAQKLNIQVNPYLIVDGVLLSANTNLALMDENGSLTIPESVKAIGEGAFADLEGLKTIIIPGTVKEIRRNAFSNNKDLENVVILEGVESIGEYAFDKCEKIINISLPESLIKIESCAFRYCTNLKEITIPSKITQLSISIFAYCYNLERVNVPENLTTIEDQAFLSCRKLNNIYISKNVNSISTSAFMNCANLTDIEIDSENETYTYDKNNGILMNTDGTDIIFISDKILKSSNTFVIPDKIVNFRFNINTYTNITTIVIPETLISIASASIFPNSIEKIELNENNKYFAIENDCLYNKDKTALVMCFSKDTEVQLANTVQTLKAYSFKQATNMQNVNLPESLLKIESRVFEGNEKLENIYIGSNVNYINPLFKMMTPSAEVEISEANPNYTIKDRILYNKDMTELIAALYSINGKYVVDANVKKIGDYAFYTRNMTEIELPEGLVEIGNAFQNCASLESIYIPSTVEKISTTCFSSATSLKQIQIDKEEGTIEGSPWGAIRGDRIVEWLR